MLACKGSTRPELAQPGTVRRRGENVIFNLAHCPDRAADALRELRILVDEAGAEQLLSAAGSADPRVGRLVGVDAMLGFLPEFSGWQAISFPAIANRIRLRIVARLALALADDAQAISLLAAANTRLVAQQRQLAAAATSQERLSAAQAENTMIHHYLAAAAARFGDALVLDGVAMLSELHQLHGERRTQAVFAMTSRGVYISPLERTIIDSHQYAFRPNKEIDDIYL
jgi:hypothetical protein